MEKKVVEYLKKLLKEEGEASTAVYTWQIFNAGIGVTYAAYSHEDMKIIVESNFDVLYTTYDDYDFSYFIEYSKR